MLEETYPEASVFKNTGDIFNGKRGKSNSFSSNLKAAKKTEPFKWDWLCLSFEPCNIDQEHLESLKRRQVKLLKYNTFKSCIASNFV